MLVVVAAVAALLLLVAAGRGGGGGGAVAQPQPQVGAGGTACYELDGLPPGNRHCYRYFVAEVGGARFFTDDPRRAVFVARNIAARGRRAGTCACLVDNRLKTAWLLCWDGAGVAAARASYSEGVS